MGTFLPTKFRLTRRRVPRFISGTNSNGVSGVWRMVGRVEDWGGVANLIAPFQNIHVLKPIGIHRTGIAGSSSSFVHITAFPSFCPLSFSMIRTAPLVALEFCCTWALPCLELHGEGTL